MDASDDVFETVCRYIFFQ